MIFRSISTPKPSKGLKIVSAQQAVPNQSISLAEMLRRFVRKEALPIGHPANFGSDGAIDPESESPFNIDLEKAKHWDLTEKAEFKDAVMVERDRVSKIARGKELADKAKKAEAEKKAFDKKVRIAARKYAKQVPGGQGPPSI